MDGRQILTDKAGREVNFISVFRNMKIEDKRTTHWIHRATEVPQHAACILEPKCK